MGWGGLTTSVSIPAISARENYTTLKWVWSTQKISPPHCEYYLGRTLWKYDILLSDSLYTVQL